MKILLPFGFFLIEEETEIVIPIPSYILGQSPTLENHIWIFQVCPTCSVF